MNVELSDPAMPWTEIWPGVQTRNVELSDPAMSWTEISPGVQTHERRIVRSCNAMNGD